MAGCALRLRFISSSSSTTTTSATYYIEMHSNGQSYNGNNNVKWTISATGQNTVSGYHPYTTSTSWQYLGQATFTWNRGSSSVTRTIKGTYETRTKQGTLTASASFTVPALPSYTITYNPSGETYDTGSARSVSRQYGSSYTVENPTYSIPNYKFLYWLNGSTQVKPGTSFTVTGNVSYKAQWELMVTTFTIGSSKPLQTFNSEAASDVTSALRTFANNYTKPDTELLGLVIKGTDEIIADKTGNLVESSLYTKSSGKWMYKGTSKEITIIYKYRYLDHNIIEYYLDSDGTIKHTTYTDIAGKTKNLDKTQPNYQNYKFSGYYINTDKPPTSINDFIFIDVLTSENSLKGAGYVDDGLMLSKDTYYKAVYTNQTEYYTIYQYHDVMRTSLDKANVFMSASDISEYIEIDGTFNNTLKEERGTTICGFVKYNSPYSKVDTLKDIQGKVISELQGIISDNISITVNNSDTFEMFTSFIGNDVIIKFKSKKTYPINEFYYVDYKTLNTTNDLLYPIASRSLSMFIPSTNVVMDINKSKSVIAFGTEAPDDEDEELVLFNRPISFKNRGKDFRQFIITHSTDFVNIYPGNYFIVNDCILSSKHGDSIKLKTGDVIQVIKNDDNTKVSLKVDSFGKSIYYQSIDI